MPDADDQALSTFRGDAVRSLRAGLALALRAAAPQRTMRRRLSKNSSDWSRSPIVWAATRAASPG